MTHQKVDAAALNTASLTHSYCAQHSHQRHAGCQHYDQHGKSQAGISLDRKQYTHSHNSSSAEERRSNASNNGKVSTVSVTNFTVPQSHVCGTAGHRTYDKTWTSRVSSINCKHFCLRISQPRCIMTVCYSAPQKYSYLLTYLLMCDTVFSLSCRRSSFWYATDIHASETLHWIILILFFALGNEDPEGYQHKAKIKSWNG